VLYPSGTTKHIWRRSNSLSLSLPTRRCDTIFPLESFVDGPDGERRLIHTTTEPLLTPAECDEIIAESEEWATREGGWTSKRHFNHPTTDIALAELPRTVSMLNTDVLPTRIYPMLGLAFEPLIPDWRAGA